jgi:adenylate kinase
MRASAIRGMRRIRLYETIYLTGAPASGKSSISGALVREHKDLHVISYGTRLIDHLRKKSGSNVEYGELRGKSSALVSADDINYVDQLIVAEINERQLSTHVILDSHPVTKEIYGFRATPFSVEVLLKLNFTAIVCLFASSETTIGRLDSDKTGRQALDAVDADAHTQLQFSLALNYGIQLNVPVHFLGTDAGDAQAVEWFRSKFEK